jgi:hypothetical protein
MEKQIQQDGRWREPIEELRRFSTCKISILFSSIKCKQEQMQKKNEKEEGGKRAGEHESGIKSEKKKDGQKQHPRSRLQQREVDFFQTPFLGRGKYEIKLRTFPAPTD